MQTNRVTGTSPFDVILPYEPPSAVIFDRLTGPANDMQRGVTPRQMPHRLPQRIEFMESKVSSRLSITERRHKRNFSKNVRRDLTFKVGDYKLVDRLQLAFFASDTAYEMPIRRYSKLLRQESGRYGVLSVSNRIQKLLKRQNV